MTDARDAAFAYLRLWQDVNHDGVSQDEELHTLPSLDVPRLHFDYKELKRTDAYVNRFRYRAKVDDAKGAKAGRWRGTCSSSPHLSRPGRRAGDVQSAVSFLNVSRPPPLS